MFVRFSRGLRIMLLATLFVAFCLPVGALAEGKLSLVRPTDKESYTPSLPQPIVSNWKEGLKNVDKKQNARKKRSADPTVTTQKPYTGPISYNAYLHTGEIHYYSFETTDEGTINLTSSGERKAPNAFISSLDGKKTYQTGSSLPAGKYALVVEKGEMLYSITLSQLSFIEKPDTNLPEIKLTKPALESPIRESYRLALQDIRFSFEGTSTNATLLTLQEQGKSGSVRHLPVGNAFQESYIIQKNTPAYSNYEFQATSQSGNSIIRVIEVVRPSLLRTNGSDQYDTAIKTSQALHPDGAKSVIITGQDDYYDIKGGAVLSHFDHAPILLTPTGKNGVLPDRVKQEIVRLKPETAYILGGSDRMSTHVEKTIQDLGIKPVRIAGAYPAQTNAKIAEYFTNKMNELGKKPETALITSSSFGPVGTQAMNISIQKGIPLLYVGDTVIHADVKDFLKRYPQYKKFVIVDDPTVVPTDIEKQLRDLASGNTVERIGDGKTLSRYESGVELAKKFQTDPRTIVLANGENNPAQPLGTIHTDAVLGAPLAAKHKGTLLLTPRDSFSTSVAQYLDEQRSKDKKVDQLFIQGGNLVVTESLVDRLLKYLQ
ncbi:cell wall-binding repeat-containing protein [Thermoactinomyces sp. DSM 45892]|uniref:cell wall-binding repeat-containing protein n=1 Tax=Thermoactinomyces sp. DSM 45892 TaxID=1882753 RepID=UPI000899A47D|nr:cell wall-binding repeat-containing protein [Thermoactinomyces sp. DSM 45892]SDZ26899.1 Putative cell wall binding repeat 2 [Thermoactinomyces sp. DSM 45892]